MFACTQLRPVPQTAQPCSPESAPAAQPHTLAVLTPKSLQVPEPRPAIPQPQPQQVGPARCYTPSCACLAFAPLRKHACFSSTARHHVVLPQPLRHSGGLHPLSPAVQEPQPVPSLPLPLPRPQRPQPQPQPRAQPQPVSSAARYALNHRLRLE